MKLVFNKKELRKIGVLFFKLFLREFLFPHPLYLFFCGSFINSATLSLFFTISAVTVNS